MTAVRHIDHGTGKATSTLPGRPDNRQGSGVDVGKEGGRFLNVKIREASFEDYSQIASLESKYFPETLSQEQWKHLWANNPVYNLLKDWPIGWVLENDEKRIVGHIGNIPLSYELHGNRLLVSTSRTWVVDQPYRSYSILLLEHYFSQNQVDLFIHPTVNADALGAYNMFGASRVPVGTWDESAFWITGYQGFTQSWLALNAFPLARALSYPLSVGLFCKDKLLGSSLRGNRDAVALELSKSFDDRFDAFWEALRKKNSHVLLGVRTREMMDWHFRYPLLHSKAWILTASNPSGLSAYSIFYRQDNPRFGLRRVRLVDFQALDGNTALLVPMLSWALEKCRNDGIDMLESFGFRTDKQTVINKIAPYERKLPSWQYFYKTRDKSLAERLSDPSVWDPSQFDGDASL